MKPLCVTKLTLVASGGAPVTQSATPQVLVAHGTPNLPWSESHTAPAPSDWRTAETLLPVVTTVRSSWGLWKRVENVVQGESAGTPIEETVPLQAASARPARSRSAVQSGRRVRR